MARSTVHLRFGGSPEAAPGLQREHGIERKLVALGLVDFVYCAAMIDGLPQ